MYQTLMTDEYRALVPKVVYWTNSLVTSGTQHVHPNQGLPPSQSQRPIDRHIEKGIAKGCSIGTEYLYVAMLDYSIVRNILSSGI
jgi:hypothetical protein